MRVASRHAPARSATRPDTMVQWRRRGEERLATVDVRQFDGETLVIHFGGQLTSVDAYTFANSLVAFADTVTSVNSLVNPGHKITVRVEALGPGCFRAVIKYVAKNIRSLFSDIIKTTITSIISAFIIENSIEGESSLEISGDVTVIVRGETKIIMPSAAHDHYEKAKATPDVQRNIARTFACIERDEAIENFGLTPNLTDESPVVQIPRRHFPTLMRLPETHGEETGSRRPQSHRATLIVLKPWIDASDRKWHFEWNGVAISAYVKDETFLARIRSQEISFRNGDALEVKLNVCQDLDEARDIWINDQASFEIEEVHNVIPAPRPGEKLL